MCVDRQQIITVIYAGSATLANQSVIGPFGIPWQSPDDQKLTFNCAQANAMLDSLATRRAPTACAMVPATTGKYAQPAHPMQYQIMVPNSLDFNGSREFSIVAGGLGEAGRQGYPAGRR